MNLLNLFIPVAAPLNRTVAFRWTPNITKYQKFLLETFLLVMIYIKTSQYLDDYNISHLRGKQ